MQAQLNISKNLLPKIPQFWESPGTAFAELVQNSVRAGATEIHLEVDVAAGMLTIRDNGRGIHSLNDFLTIGDSQWEKEVVEPAGMGFYAHFGYSKQTVVESRGMRYTFTPACLSGTPVEVEPCPDTGWTVIAIQGAQPLNEIAWARMRPLPPPAQDLIFAVNGQEIPNPLAAMTPLATSVGVVYLRQTDGPSGLPTGLWEGLPVGYTYSVHQTLWVHDQEYVWAVDPACGVRPRLPGREGFIQDASYHNALATLTQAIEAYCQGRAGELDPQTLPEVLDWPKQELATALAAAEIRERMVIQWVCNHLYLPVELFEGEWYTEDGYPDYPTTNHVQVRRDQVVCFHLEATEHSEGEVVQALLNTQAGRWKGWNTHPEETPETVAFVYNEGGETLKLAGLQRLGRGWVAQAVSIGGRVVLDGNGRGEWPGSAGPGLFFHEGEPVWVGNPGDILEKAEELADLWFFCEHHAEDSVTGELVGSNNEFSVSLLQRHLAERYDLGEDINLRNWLRATRDKMQWEVPQKYRPLFEQALAKAERQAVKRGYTLVEPLTHARGRVP
jgi:hypothetical protein